MMTAATIIQNMQERGIRLAATDRGTVRVTPAELLTDADRALLRKHKPDVLAELRGVNLVNMVNMDFGYLPPPRIVHSPAPATVSCGQCAEFEPGPTHWARGVGRCSRTIDGLPPVASRGYGACFPDAPRRCPDYHPLED